VCTGGTQSLRLQLAHHTNVSLLLATTAASQAGVPGWRRSLLAEQDPQVAGATSTTVVSGEHFSSFSAFAVATWCQVWHWPPCLPLPRLPCACRV